MRRLHNLCVLKVGCWLERGKVVSLCIVLASSRLWSASKHVSNVPGREFIVCASSLTLSFEVLNGLGTVVGRSLRKPFDHIAVEVAYSGQRFMQCKPVSDSALHHLPAGLYVIKS